jgi:hypothetical protein
MSTTRACPDWPTLMEIAPDVQFRHYTLAEVQLPVEAFVQLEGVDAGAVLVCCDLEAHIFNPGHTDPRVVDALAGTHWIDVHEMTTQSHRPTAEDPDVDETG